MNQDELLSIVEAEEADSVGASTTQLAEQRRKAMQYYYGQPYGNEVEGRSQVVTTEVLDAIEGILPSLLGIFTSSDEVVRFEPQGPEDDGASSQATDYINYIFSRENNGFIALYCFFKDALLQKNGFLKVYWEEYEDSTKETYNGLSDDQFAYLSQDDSVTLVEHTAYPGAEGVTHDAVFRRTAKKGKVCIDPVPPEEVFVSRGCANDLKKARFVEHKSKKTISELREMGFEVPDTLSDDSEAEFNVERIERLKFDDSTAGSQQSEGSNDKSSRSVWVCEAYLKVDYDGDGIAELRKVTKVGKTVLDNEEVDSIPFVTTTPILMPHKLYGMSIADLVMDIQLIKSTVTRQLLDNAYLANNGRYEALEGMVNMNDLLTNRPGGIVRVKTLGAVKRIDTPLLGAPAFQLLEYFDAVKENRVGVTRYNQGLDADSLNKTAHGMELIRNASMQRIELIARIFAETGVKDLFWKILELVSKHQQKAKVVKLRNQWVTVDPREWRNKFNMTVTVGLGTGSQQAVQQGAQLLMATQFELLKAGLGGTVVSPHNLFASARRIAKVVDPKNADAYFTDPKTVPPQPEKPDPDMLKLQLQDKHKTMQMQQRVQQAQQTLAVEGERLKLERERLQADFAKHREQLQSESRKDSIEAAAASLDLKTREAQLRIKEEMARLESMQIDGQAKMVELALSAKEAEAQREQMLTETAMKADEMVMKHREAVGKADLERTKVSSDVSTVMKKVDENTKAISALIQMQTRISDEVKEVAKLAARKKKIKVVREGGKIVGATED